MKDKKPKKEAPKLPEPVINDAKTAPASKGSAPVEHEPFKLLDGSEISRKTAVKLAAFRQELFADVDAEVTRLTADPKLVSAMIKRELEKGVIEAAKRQAGLSSSSFNPELVAHGRMAQIVEACTSKWLEAHIKPILDKIVSEYLETNKPAITAFVLHYFKDRIREEITWISSRDVRESIEKLVSGSLGRDDVGKILQEYNRQHPAPPKAKGEKTSYDEWLEDEDENAAEDED